MAFYPLQFYLLFKGFVLWIFFERVPFELFSNRIFRVALLFICQCSFLSFITFEIRRSFYIISCHRLLCQVFLHNSTFFLLSLSTILDLHLSDVFYLITPFSICQQEIYFFTIFFLISSSFLLIALYPHHKSGKTLSSSELPCYKYNH